LPAGLKKTDDLYLTGYKFALPDGIKDKDYR
jgi:hypothetical protein